MSNRWWTEKDVALLRAKAVTHTPKELAQLLGRTRTSIAQKMWQLGIPSKDRVAAWTEADKSYLLKEFNPDQQGPSALAIAKHLGRTRSSVVNELRRLGFWERLGEYKPWTKAELFELMSGCETLTNHELARKLGRSYTSVKFKMYRLGYKPLCAVYSLKEVRANTGYADYQLRRAKKKTGQKWHKARSNRFVIHENQVQELCEYLKEEGRSSASAA